MKSLKMTPEEEVQSIADDLIEQYQELTARAAILIKKDPQLMKPFLYTLKYGGGLMTSIMRKEIEYIIKNNLI